MTRTEHTHEAADDIHHAHHRASVRERLARERAQKALARVPGWLGAGRRWNAFVEPDCPCCQPAAARPGR